MPVDFDREQAWWDQKAPKEENVSEDIAVNRALRWREIERNLSGVRSILDVGAGTGLFSIPLAKRGFRVTHLDLSPAMIRIAGEKAGGMENLIFVEANATDLSQFGDRSFDLVLNMDGAISFCGEEADRALAESCRVAGKKVLFTVTHHALLTAVCVQAGLQVFGRIVPAAWEMLNTGYWRQEQFPENPGLTKGNTQDYCGPMKAYRPSELRNLVESHGFRVLRCGGIGSLASQCRKEDLDKAQEKQEVFEEFLDICERYDEEVLPNGPGTRQRGGLIIVGERT